MAINKNIVSNYASRLWSGLSTFLFVPFYLRILGPESFGLVSFSTVLLGLLFVLDMGMSSAFARQVAIESDTSKLGDLLKSLELVYLGVMLIAFLIALGVSGFISKDWLNTSSLDPARMHISVSLMLTAAILQVMISLYTGGLLGANRHVQAAAFQIGFSIVRSGIVLIPLAIWPMVELVFAWQLAASLTFLLLMRRSVWRMLNGGANARFSGAALRQIRGFSAGMFGISVIAAINTQADKLVISRLFSLEQLGLYSIASLIGQIPSMIALPLAVTVLPRLTGHIARGDQNSLVDDYMSFSFMIGAVSAVATTGIVVGAAPILAILTGRPPSPDVVLVTRVLALGGFFLAAQFMPYHLAIANGHTRTNFRLGVVSALVLPPSMIVAVQHLGLLGSALPWLAMNAIAAALLACLLTPRFLGSFLARWIWEANLLPAGVAVATIAPAAVILNGRDSTPLALSVIVGLCAGALAINGLLFSLRISRDQPRRAASIEKVR